MERLKLEQEEKGADEKYNYKEGQRGLFVDLSYHLGYFSVLFSHTHTHAHTELEGSDGWLGSGSMLS